ncbi:hypothetical protein ACFL27_01485 [candidate division CSSED10-310 bacterium]|uniref:Glycosyltransferase RgtA/B/C/D-like domain-containing protein n=1 Tax=candidate division CSSED10-310 bacterium TaxID=2855610 RepID=A0ABV6YRM2_UNCC1
MESMNIASNSNPVFKAQHFRGHLLIPLLLVIPAAVTRLKPMEQIQTFWVDSLFYVTLARNLFFSGYEILNVSHSHYPPLYPIIIAILHLIFGWAGDQVAMAKIVSFLGGVVMVPLLYLLSFGLFKDRFISISISIYTILNPYLILYSALVFTESLYSMVAVLILFLLHKQYIGPAAFISGLAYLLRAEAIIFIVPIVYACGLYQWKRLIKSGILFLTPVLPWMIRNFLIFDNPFQSGYFPILSHNYGWNIRFLFNYFYTMGPIMVILSVLGIVLCFQRSCLPAILYIFCGNLLHCIWPFSYERFTLPYLVILAIFAATGPGKLVALFSDKKEWKQITGILTVILMFTLGIIAYRADLDPLVLQESTRSTAYVQAIKDLKAGGVQGSVITADIGLVAYYGQLPAVSLWSAKKSDIFEFIYEQYDQGARYIIISNYYYVDRRLKDILNASPLDPVIFPNSKASAGSKTIILIPLGVFHCQQKYFLPDPSKVYARKISREHRAEVRIYHIVKKASHQAF